MPFNLGSPKDPNAAKAAMIKAAREQAAPTASAGAIQKWVSPADAKDRIRIVFDDSGSMSSYITQAKEGVVEFYRNCIPNQTAVAVHMMCAKGQEIENLNSNLIEAARMIKEAEPGLGSTPMFVTAMSAMALSPKLTRMVLFTDGSPTDQLDGGELLKGDSYSYGSSSFVTVFKKSSADVLIERAKELRVPIDTVYFGSGSEYDKPRIELLKYIAERTGGYFLHFDPAKVNFRTAFKYLAPVNRLMLASESVRKEIEDGTRN